MSEKDFNALFSKNLKNLMYSNNISQAELARKLNVSSAAVNTWCRGLKVPRMDKVDAMCSLFRCSRSDLIEDKSAEPVPPRRRGVTIKVLGRVAAGIPIEAVEDIIDTEEITEELAATGEFFGLKIHGDSMEPRICEGDVVIVRQQDDAESGDLVIAMVNGSDATCKRLKKYAGGIMLLSNNAKYEPMIYSEDDILSKPVRIIGKVVELRGKF